MLRFFFVFTPITPPTSEKKDIAISFISENREGAEKLIIREIINEIENNTRPFINPYRSPFSFKNFEMVIPPKKAPVEKLKRFNKFRATSFIFVFNKIIDETTIITNVVEIDIITETIKDLINI